MTGDLERMVRLLVVDEAIGLSRDEAERAVRLVLTEFRAASEGMLMASGVSNVPAQWAETAIVCAVDYVLGIEE